MSADNTINDDERVNRFKALLGRKIGSLRARTDVTKLMQRSKGAGGAKVYGILVGMYKYKAPDGTSSSMNDVVLYVARVEPPADGDNEQCMAVDGGSAYDFVGVPSKKLREALAKVPNMYPADVLRIVERIGGGRIVSFSVGDDGIDKVPPGESDVVCLSGVRLQVYEKKEGGLGSRFGASDVTVAQPATPAGVESLFGYARDSVCAVPPFRAVMQNGGKITALHIVDVNSVNVGPVLFQATQTDMASIGFEETSMGKGKGTPALNALTLAVLAQYDLSHPLEDNDVHAYLTSMRGTAGVTVDDSCITFTYMVRVYVDARTITKALGAACPELVRAIWTALGATAKFSALLRITDRASSQMRLNMGNTDSSDVKAIFDSKAASLYVPWSTFCNAGMRITRAEALQNKWTHADEIPTRKTRVDYRLMNNGLRGDDVPDDAEFVVLSPGLQCASRTDANPTPWNALNEAQRAELLATGEATTDDGVLITLNLDEPLVCVVHSPAAVAGALADKERAAMNGALGHVSRKRVRGSDAGSDADEPDAKRQRDEDDDADDALGESE